MIDWSRSDRAAGVTLAIATVAALAWANLDGPGYVHAWSTVPSWLGFSDLHFTAREWVNGGLMTLFFVVIGLEIRREMTAGELASWRRAAGPVIAAVAGMVAPALVYVAVVGDRPGGHGWGIPMATDVAFSLGALALLAPTASLRLRVFLMTLGVADDILSIVVLVAVYSAAVEPAFAVAGVGCLVAMVGVRLIRGPAGAIALTFGAAAWWTFARGGIEPAVVGVAIGSAGLASRAPPATTHDLGPRAWEHRLNPVVSLLVLPAFALANAGVDIGHLDVSSSIAFPVFVAVLLARVVGKPLGVWLGATLFRAQGSPRSRLGLGTVASVGFTVPLLIARVAFGDGALADSATAALLAGTLVGALLTAPLLRASGNSPS